MRILALLGLIVLPVMVQAQQPVRDALQRQVFDRLIENYRVQAGLDDAQFTQFRGVLERQFRDRRQSEMAYRRLLRAVESQLRPGVAADVDSLDVLLQAITAHHDQRARSEAAYMQEYEAFLTSVQRAQLVVTLERFQRQIENLIRRRPGDQRSQ